MIRVNCINLESRTERKNHIEIEFSDRHEFNLRIVQAIKHEVGAIGLWQSLIGVVKEMSLYDDEYFIFCEDDHTFTKHYTPEVLQEGIETAKSHNADILLGGVSWLETAVQVSDRMFWVDKYTGNQFVVIFKKFYPVILGITDFENMTAEEIHNAVRGYYSWPCAYFFLENKRIKVIKSLLGGNTAAKAGTVTESENELIIACKNGTLIRLTEVQPEGSKPMSAKQMLCGRPIKAGTVLGKSNG